MQGLREPEKGVLNVFNFDRFELPEEMREPLREAMRATAPETFDAFCLALDKAVRDLGGDPRYEIARMQALRTYEPAEAEKIAAAAIADEPPLA